ncbi:thiamine pyrophosphate-binding protein [Candidatus Uabimicrobium sp. HlEnr_7]|uniref:thiamine pyrophosphate-binding protein n=1 Tax=Candidatus Uabimicrobium helgolandensis TaxID=3095367 RepID=UPI0035562A05
MQEPDFQLWTEISGKPRMADFLVESLYRAGAKYIFAMPAESLNSIIDAIRKHKKIKLITVRHEANGALMASAYSKITGNLGVCMGTTGPGSTHLPLGCYDAKADCTKMIALSGQVPSHQVGTGGFQEIDALSLFQNSCKYNYLLTSRDQTPLIAQICSETVFHNCSSHIAFASDIMKTKVNMKALPSFQSSDFTPNLPMIDCKSILQRIQCQKPIIVVGKEGEKKEVLALANKWQAPIIVLPEAISFLNIVKDHPVLRWNNNKENPCNNLINDAHHILLIGEHSYNFSTLTNGVTSRKITQISPSDHYYRKKVDTQSISGEISSIVPQIAKEISQQTDKDWLQETQNASNWRPELTIPQEVLLALDKCIPTDANVSVEPGDIWNDVFFHWPTRERKITSSFHLQAPGYGFAGAVSAALAYPHNLSYAFVSEGFKLSMPDLLSVRKYGLPLKIVHFENEDEKDLNLVKFAQASHCESAKGTIENSHAVLENQRKDKLPSLVSFPISYKKYTPEGKKQTFASNIIEIFSNAGAKKIYGVENSKTTIWQENIDKTKLDFVPVVHCESASMMASACYKSEKALGICVVTEAYELPLQLNGLYDANYDYSPAIIITPKYNNLDFFDSKALFKDVVCASLDIKANKDSLQKLANAVNYILHEKKVLHLSVDWELLSNPKIEFQQDTVLSSNLPTALQTQKASKVLQKAKKIVILVGGGAKGAGKEIEALAVKLCAPVVCTMQGCGVTSENFSHFVGRTGASGHRAAFCAIEQCEILLILGSSNRAAVFGLVGNFEIIQVDINPKQFGKREQKTIGIQGDTKQTLISILEDISEISVCIHRQKFLTKYSNKYKKWWQKQLRKKHSGNMIQPSSICPTLINVLDKHKKDVALTVDVGVTTLWVYRFFMRPNPIIWTGSFATMGFSLPAAIAISNFYRKKVWVMAGDGGIAVTMVELLSAVKQKLPIVVIVFNNNKLAAIKFEQEVMGWPEYESYLFNCNFAEYAESLGATGIRVTNNKEMKQAMEQAIILETPCVIDVVCNPHEKPFPPKFKIVNLRGYIFALLRERYLNAITLFKKSDGIVNVPTRYKNDKVVDD